MYISELLISTNNVKGSQLKDFLQRKIWRDHILCNDCAESSVRRGSV